MGILSSFTVNKTMTSSTRICVGLNIDIGLLDEVLSGISGKTMQGSFWIMTNITFHCLCQPDKGENKSVEKQKWSREPTMMMSKILLETNICLARRRFQGF